MRVREDREPQVVQGPPVPGHCYVAERREEKRKAQQAEQKGKQTIQQMFASAASCSQVHTLTLTLGECVGRLLSPVLSNPRVSCGKTISRLSHIRGNRPLRNHPITPAPFGIPS
jgi:hypothetical protein